VGMDPYGGNSTLGKYLKTGDGWLLVVMDGKLKSGS